MRRITRAGIEVNIGDRIPIDGIRINGVPLITPIKLDNSVILTQRLVELNPNIFEVEEIPDYFECINARFNSSFTLGKIYKLSSTKDYPRKLHVNTDYGDVVGVFYWDESYIEEDHNCFKPTTKEEFEKQEMLAKAKKDYPVGTVFRSLIIPDQIQEVTEATHSIETIFGNGDLYATVRTDKHFGGGCLFCEGKWAEIIPKSLSQKLVKLIANTPSGETRDTLFQALIQVQMNEKCIILTKNDLRDLAPFNIHDVKWQDFKESSITKQEYLEAEVVIFIYESLSKVLKNK